MPPRPLKRPRVIGRLLCRLGRHDWQLVYVQSLWSGETWAEKRWANSTYQCWRCLVRRVESTSP